MDRDDILHHLVGIGGPATPERRPLTAKEAGQRFRAALEHANITNEHAAMRSGVTGPTISAYINGARIPSWARIYYLIQTIPLDPRFFFHEIMGTPPQIKSKREIRGAGYSEARRYKSKRDVCKEVPMGPKFQVEAYTDLENAIFVCSSMAESDIMDELSRKTPNVLWTNVANSVQCKDWITNKHYVFQFRAK